MKRCILIIAIFLIRGFCDLHAQERLYHIDGRISATDNGRMVMLFTMEGDSICSTDTATVNDGKFRFEGKESLRDFAIIAIGNFPDKVKSLELVLEQGDIRVNMDSIPTATGTYYNDLYNKYKVEYPSAGKLKASLVDKFQIALPSEKNKLDSLFVEYYNKRKSFIKEQIANVVGFKTLRDEVQLFFEPELNEFLACNERLKSDPVIQERIKFLKKQEMLNTQRIQSIGLKYQDFQLGTTDGKIKRISDFVSESDYLFIDFWASWCGPCIASMPHVKSAYDKYKDRGLNVIVISLDDNRTTWLGALKQIKVQLPQFLIKREENKALQKAYKIKGVPYGVLLNKKGEIIGVDLRGETLDAFMEQLLKK